MPDIRADEPEAREPERLVFGDGEGSAHEGRRAVGSKGRPSRTVLVEGLEVLIGRGDRENDALTFEVAEPHDVWLHVGGGTPGSHVIVRAGEPDGAVPGSVVRRAAELAAWHSKARHARMVEVHVCRTRDVTKPRGAPPGLVQLARWRRLRMRPRGATDEPDGEP